MEPPSAAARALVATAAALALADASIVALALPPILAEMHTTVTGVRAKNPTSPNIGQATIITADGKRVFGGAANRDGTGGRDAQAGAQN